MNIQLKKGVLKYAVLLVLKQEDCYGYELVSRISAFIDISEGTIYPLLKRLKSENLVETYLKESLDGPARKYYFLTEEGVRACQVLSDEWHKITDGIEQLAQLKE